jgi:peptidoglycan/LPS O-acetylase OafA/YrhL
MALTKFSKPESFERLTPEQLQSQTIDLLRFPLAIMVIFIHMNPHMVSPVNGDISLFSGLGIFNIVAITLSRILSKIAVPTFFFISGFLFFYKNQTWQWSTYKRKMQRRIHTLVIPYFLWNIVAFMLPLLMYTQAVIRHHIPMSDLIGLIAENNWRIFYDINTWSSGQVNWLGQALSSTGPFDLPLWFLRDLIVVTVFAPAIYWVVKRLKIWGIIVLFIAYISRIWLQVPGFSIGAFFMFALGAYFAVNSLNIVTIAQRYKALIVPICIALFVFSVTTYNTSNISFQTLSLVYVPFGVFTAFYIASKLIERYRIKPNKLLVSSCFFVYAFHGIWDSFGPIQISSRLLHCIIPGESGIETVVVYLTGPFLTAFICIAILYLCRKICPKLILLLSGNK